MAKAPERKSPAKTKGNFRKEIPLAKRGKMAVSSMKNASGNNARRQRKGTRNITGPAFD